MPFINLIDATTDVYSADLRGTATVSLMRSVRSVTSVGMQYADVRTVGQAGFAYITATNLTLNGATSPTASQQGSRQATLGGYGEEEVSVADRVFVTGALRIDAGSGFGRSYATAAYPKASVSWLAVSGAQTTVRIRGAFGESGVQPANGAALQLYTPNTTYLTGGAVSTTILDWPGNPTLRPERSAEFEGGIDVSGWGNRVSLELTGYDKMTQDALVNVNLGADLGAYTYQENIGRVRNTGVEGSVTVGLIASRSVNWEVGINASLNRNTLVSLAPGVAAQPGSVYRDQYRQAAGYPLYGIWAQNLSYSDANHDGIIEAGEITLADSATYQGPSLPTQEASISTHLGFWRGTLTVGGLIDYRGGYRISNSVQELADISVLNARQANDPTAPLWLQARTVANSIPGAYNVAPDIENGAFVRLREVSVTYAVPRSISHAIRVQTLGVTGAVRNLALWTRYTGVDPEVSNTNGFNVQAAPTTNGYAVNNDVREDGGAVPLARYWVLRINVGW